LELATPLAQFGLFGGENRSHDRLCGDVLVPLRRGFLEKGIYGILNGFILKERLGRRLFIYARQTHNKLCHFFDFPAYV
jgi:hypothetical protein